MSSRMPTKSVERHADLTETIYRIPYHDKMVRHREDGPASIREYYDGRYIETWLYHGKIHRYGGPAHTTIRCNMLFYVHGEYVTHKVNEWLSERNYTWETMSDIEKWELELFMRCLG